MAIVLDSMGSDNRPMPEVEAAVTASNMLNERIILVGDKNLLKSKLSTISGDQSKISIMHAPEALDMKDHIAEARAKKQNTMRVGMELVKDGEGKAFVTMGNTGLAMYYAQKIFGSIEGVIRPALCAIFPVKNGKAVLLDIGANAECRPEFLVQFGIMGQIYAQTMLGIANPRIGLLSNGEEKGKGNELVKNTFPLLDNTDLNFIGNVEGKEFFSGRVDVAVTDGFTGNVFLKSAEAVADLMLNVIKTELTSSVITSIGAALAKPAFRKVKRMLDPGEIGAAPLLGIDSLIFVGHGRSDARAVVNSIKAAKTAVDNSLLEKLQVAITSNLERE